MLYGTLLLSGFQGHAMMRPFSHLYSHLLGEIIESKTANHQDEARADIHAWGFWGQRQGTVSQKNFGVENFCVLKIQHNIFLSLA